MNGIQKRGKDFFDGKFEILKENLLSVNNEIGRSGHEFQRELHQLLCSELNDKNRTILEKVLNGHISVENPVEDLAELLSKANLSGNSQLPSETELDELLDEPTERMYYCGLLKHEYLESLGIDQKEIVEDILNRSKNVQDQNENYLQPDSWSKNFLTGNNITKRYNADGSVDVSTINYWDYKK